MEPIDSVTLHPLTRKPFPGGSYNPYIPQLLELGNDIESNPGPDTRASQKPATCTQMEELKAMMKEIPNTTSAD